MIGKRKYFLLELLVEARRQFMIFWMRKVFPIWVRYLFSQFLKAGTPCWEKVLQVQGRRLRIWNLFWKRYQCLRKIFISIELNHVTHFTTQEFKSHGDHPKPMSFLLFKTVKLIKGVIVWIHMLPILPIRFHWKLMERTEFAR